MNDRHLKAFLLSADYNSFTKAASASYISTTALISQISLLERDTGLTLFRRTPRGIELTREGQVFYDYAVRILSLCDEAIKTAQLAGKESQNVITLLGGDLNFTQEFKHFCITYMQQKPDVTIVFDDNSLQDLLERIHKDSSLLLAIGKMKAQYENNLGFIPFFQDQLLVLIPNGHPLLSKQELLPEDLAGYTLLCEKQVLDAVDYNEMFHDIPDVQLVYCEPFHSELPILNAFAKNQLVLRSKRWSCFALDLIKEVPLKCDADMTVGLYYNKDCPDYVNEFVSKLL